MPTLTPGAGRGWSGFQPLPDAEERERQLVKMKRRATGLLVLMAIVFVVAHHYEPTYAWLGYVRATAEAAMVGGVADWFAITALFRHPLNIPIPHTAIIPTRKDRIGRTLGNFVQHNFLSADVLGPKIQSMGPSRRAAEWLRRPENARAVSRHAALDCNQCHNAPVQHKVTPRTVHPEKPRTRLFCAKCHGKDANSSKEIPRIDVDTHGGRYLCWQCHYPHMPEGI